MKTILIVDDEYALVENLAELLRDEGYRVVSAANGTDGLARVASEKPDLVITDLMMPIADGRELVRGVRALADFDHFRRAHERFEQERCADGTGRRQAGRIGIPPEALRVGEAARLRRRTDRPRREGRGLKEARRERSFRARTLPSLDAKRSAAHSQQRGQTPTGVRAGRPPGLPRADRRHRGARRAAGHRHGVQQAGGEAVGASPARRAGQSGHHPRRERADGGRGQPPAHADRRLLARRRPPRRAHVERRALRAGARRQGRPRRLPLRPPPRRGVRPRRLRRVAAHDLQQPDGPRRPPCRSGARARPHRRGGGVRAHRRVQEPLHRQRYRRRALPRRGPLERRGPPRAHRLARRRRPPQGRRQSSPPPSAARTPSGASRRSFARRRRASSTSSRSSSAIRSSSGCSSRSS